jgi:hypothetical protein
VVSTARAGLLSLLLALVAPACLEPLPAPEPCEAPTVPSETGCVCPEGFFARIGTDGSLARDCSSCRGSFEFVDDQNECAPCVQPKEKVNGRCLACPLPGPPATQCYPQVVDWTVEMGNGCIATADNYDGFSCLTGKIGADAVAECAPAGTAPVIDACYAPREGATGNCPPEVQAIVEDAQCFPLDPAAISILEVDTAVSCTCRSPDRLARCDGFGVIMGGVGHEADPTPVTFASLLIGLPTELPPRGKLGVYVRVQGFAVPFIVQGITVEEAVGAWAFFTTKGYDSLVGFGLEQDGIPLIGDLSAGLAYGEGIAPRPEFFVLTPQEIVGGTDELALFEVDCIIPFVIGE